MKLPSCFQIGDEVASHGRKHTVTAVTFDEMKVYYDLTGREGPSYRVPSHEVCPAPRLIDPQP